MPGRSMMPAALACLALAVVAAAAAPAAPAPAPAAGSSGARFSVLHINDNHAR